MLKKTLLLEWRHWPALPLAVLIYVAVPGFVSLPSAHPVSQIKITGHQHEQSDSPKDDNSPFFVGVANNHDAIEALSGVAAVVVAFGLMVVTGFLWGATRNLATSTAGLRDAAHEQSDEMRNARDLAEKQLALAADEHGLAGRQHGLQRLQYLAEHRPRINVRSIGIATEKGYALFEADRPIRGSLVIFNAGASEATIRQAEYRFYMTTSGLPMVPPLSPEEVKALMADLPQKMDGHGSCLVPIETAALGERARSVLHGNAVKLYVMGAIMYSDWDLKERWMGFCREYIPAERIGGEGRFVPVDNYDYEYSD